MDASTPTIPMIAQFCGYLFDDLKRVLRTIRGYKTALADYYSQSVIDIKNDQSLMWLLTRFCREKLSLECYRKI